MTRRISVKSLFAKHLHPALLTLLLTLPGPAAAQDRLNIYTVNYPLQYFAERIAGDRAEVHLPAPPDVDPAFWMPDRDIIQQYRQSDLLLLNGAGYAKWTHHVSLPRRRSLDTTRAVRDRYLATATGPRHKHGPGGEHQHGGTAFTTWLDPTLAIAQADAVRQALTRLRPTDTETFDTRFEQLRGELQALDRQLDAITSQKPDLPLLASHPVYQYLAGRYGLNLKSLHWEPDSEPDPAQWQALDARLQQHPARWMLWENDPLPAIAERLAARGISVVVYRPAGNRPADGDLMTVMQENARSLMRAFDD